MTREEAIQILKPFREAMIDQHGCPISDAVFAIDVAIKSLEAWESVIEEINEVDFCFLIAESGSCSAEVLKTSLLNTIKKALKEVEE